MATVKHCRGLALACSDRGQYHVAGLNHRTMIEKLHKTEGKDCTCGARPIPVFYLETPGPIKCMVCWGKVFEIQNFFENFPEDFDIKNYPDEWQPRFSYLIYHYRKEKKFEPSNDFAFMDSFYSMIFHKVNTARTITQLNYPFYKTT